MCFRWGKEDIIKPFKLDEAQEALSRETDPGDGDFGGEGLWLAKGATPIAQDQDRSQMRRRQGHFRDHSGGGTHGPDRGWEDFCVAAVEEVIRTGERGSWHVFAQGGSKDRVATWLEYKKSREVDALLLRPHPFEFIPYFDA